MLPVKNSVVPPNLLTACAGVCARRGGDALHEQPSRQLRPSPKSRARHRPGVLRFPRVSTRG
eukprot:6326295-Pyramimonas_sp.AAC.1